MWKFVLYQKTPPFMGELSNEVRLRGNISRHLPAPSYSPFNCSLHSQPQRWLEYGRLASLPLAILPIPPDSPLAASPTGRARLESPVNGDSFWVCNTMCQFSPCFIPRSGRSAPAPSPANHISIGGKKLGIGPGSAHKVVARWRRGACLQLPVLELLRFAASSAGRAQLRNVASQLGGSRPGKRSKYQIPQKQTARFCVLFVFVVSGSYLQLILPYRSH